MLPSRPVLLKLRSMVITLALLFPRRFNEGFIWCTQTWNQAWNPPQRKCPARIHLSLHLVSPNNPISKEESNDATEEGDIIAFTGGGIFFWWQVGWVSQAHIPDNARLVGASAGSLTALCAKCGVGADKAYIAALSLCDKHGIFGRPLGLAMKWGELVREWLDIVLPADAHERCSGKVHILVSTVDPVLWPPIQRTRVTDFSSRSDLIDCAMASVHIPFFMDGALFASYRGKLCFDGSFLQQPGELAIPNPVRNEAPDSVLSPLIFVDHKDDDMLQESAFLRLKPGPGLVHELLDKGANFARRMNALNSSNTCNGFS